MKKFIAIVSLIIIFFVLYILQADFFSWFTIASVKPNLFIIFVLFIGLFAGKKVGFILGTILGLILDFLIGRTIGISAILLGLTGIFGDYLEKNFKKESRFTIMLMVIVTTAIYEIINYIYYVFRLSVNIEISDFIKILLIEALYNTIIVIIVYPLIQKFGNYIENAFKSKNILTRYF